MDEKELFSQPARGGPGPARSQLTEEQLAELKKPLDEKRVERRKAKFGTVEYLPTWDVINRANEIFGYGGWQREIIRLEKVYEEELDGTYTVGYLCESRVVVGETVHEDVGFGAAINYAEPTAAHEKAMKAAVSDSLKRCLRAFGPQFGLSLYKSAERRDVEEGEAREAPRGITEKQLARLRRDLKAQGLREEDLVEYINLKTGRDYASLEDLPLRLASRAITRFSEDGPAFAKEIRQAL
ncbi:MAG: RAD52 family DNA repair protein [Candidatus Acetothermia bacterium]|jgi:DNA repair and recombination protein RAD52|nr:RAD52 family DNA repair protein [Candidatus Acetothermia bacterium]MDH7504806.1 RAD52 family DNA repair protein [Candidatus Acetothermia bacterium]